MVCYHSITQPILTSTGRLHNWPVFLSLRVQSGAQRGSCRRVQQHLPPPMQQFPWLFAPLALVTTFKTMDTAKNVVQKRRVGGGADFCMAEGRDNLRCVQCSGLDTCKFPMIDCNGLLTLHDKIMVPRPVRKEKIKVAEIRVK